jgi:hypothetical protein
MQSGQLGWDSVEERLLGFGKGRGWDAFLAGLGLQVRDHAFDDPVQVVGAQVGLAGLAEAEHVHGHLHDLLEVAIHDAPAFVQVVKVLASVG